MLAKFPLLRRNDSDSARMTREYVATRLNCVSRRSDRFSPGVEIDKILVKIPRTFLHPVYKRRESSTSRWSPINSPTPSTAFRLMNVCFSTRIFPSNDFARVRSAFGGGSSAFHGELPLNRDDDAVNLDAERTCSRSPRCLCADATGYNEVTARKPASSSVERSPEKRKFFHGLADN